MSENARESQSLVEQDIKADDAESLLDILDIAERCIEEERERGGSVDARIGVLAALAGGLVGGVFAVGAFSEIPNSGAVSAPLYLSCVAAALLFAFRCLFYVVLSVGGQAGHRIVPALLIKGELAGKSRAKDLKVIVRWRLWFLKKLTEANTLKLYWVSCASWAIASSYIYVGLAAVVLFGVSAVDSVHNTALDPVIAGIKSGTGELRWLLVAIHWVVATAWFFSSNRLLGRWSVWCPR